MRLNATQVGAVSAQLGAEPVPDETMTHTNLLNHFGDHTFYIGPEGAYVWEPVAFPKSENPQIEAVQIASWADDERTMLKPEPPEPTGTIVTVQPH